jgi:hypothetical protein
MRAETFAVFHAESQVDAQADTRAEHYADGLAKTGSQT